MSSTSALPGPPDSALASADVPTAFEEYRLVRLLGRGSMGEVYLAHDTRLERPVAIKFLSRERNAGAPHRREWLQQEARAIARVRHPNVVTALRTGEVSGRPFLVSEYLRGQSLERLPLPLRWERALEVVLGLARGLAAAHRQGVLHRDIKPANVFLTEDDTVKLLDFGLAQLADAEEPAADVLVPAPTPLLPLLGGQVRGGSTLTASHRLLPPRPASDDSGRAASQPAPAIVGTPLYMAPELWRGQPATQRTDVYGFGALAFELCTGTAPFAQLPLEELPRIIQVEDAPALSGRAPGIDARFAALVQQCLSREPHLRFESGDALLQALEPLARPQAEGPSGRGKFSPVVR